ncbi:MAG: alpha/beta fold hydrolase [Myxococcota bacterium]
MPDIIRRRAGWWQRTGSVLASDGVPVAYALGGPPEQLSLVCCNGLGVSTFFWNYLGEYFTHRFQVVVWDYRGHGSSGRPRNPQNLTIAALVDDLIRVMDSCGVQQAVLLGHSLGTQVILEAWHRHPDRVKALVPILGAPGRPADTLLDPRVGQALFRLVYLLGTQAPEAVQLTLRATLHRNLTWHLIRRSGLVHPDLCRPEDIEPYLEHLSRQDIEVFAEMLRAAQEHDATPFLSQIAVPTLVVAGERDLFTPRHLSIEMATRIQGAELLEIPRGSHAALVEQPELINLRLEKFLTERVLPNQASAPSLGSEDLTNES